MKHCLCTQRLLKLKSQLADAYSARRRPASQEVSISKCDLAWRWVMMDHS